MWGVGLVGKAKIFNDVDLADVSVETKESSTGFGTFGAPEQQTMEHDGGGDDKSYMTRAWDQAIMSWHAISSGSSASERSASDTSQTPGAPGLPASQESATCVNTDADELPDGCKKLEDNCGTDKSTDVAF
ncbi:hypothetical protein CYMTET_56794 [Cymbomonas tetramitiformis]|uniref:Uncharacterized protein n=1 Tax=Cymbomonas tetramitiformis TaxID=36881 RepID=A0AAE0BBZ7_9CHLO|nr:hypothetical protein CYMTET_56794 [Cymbomonas tetramitiformis]